MVDCGSEGKDSSRVEPELAPEGKEPELASQSTESEGSSTYRSSANKAGCGGEHHLA